MLYLHGFKIASRLCTVSALGNQPFCTKQTQAYRSNMLHVRAHNCELVQALCLNEKTYLTSHSLDLWLKHKHALSIEDYQTMNDNNHRDRRLTVGNSFYLIDARKQIEYEYSHIQGSINMPCMVPPVELVQRVDKKMPIVVYCSGGRRSSMFANRLCKLGFQNVYTLQGGLCQWIKDNYPVIRDGRLYSMSEEQEEKEKQKSIKKQTAVIRLLSSLKTRIVSSVYFRNVLMPASEHKRITTTPSPNSNWGVQFPY